MAKFYGIGVGPGDEKLLTVKAVETIQSVDVIYVPITKMKRRSVALQIASEYIPESTRVEKRLFPLTRDRSVNEPYWKEHAKEIEAELDAGHSVAFLTLGDPMTYATFAYLVRYMQEGYEIETISGITSYNQITALLNRPLAMDDEAFVVVAATAEENKLRTAIENFETVVILKIANHLDKVLPLLEEYQIQDRARIVIEATRDKEEIIEDVRQLSVDQKIPYFSTMILYLSDWWDEDEG